MQPTTEGTYRVLESTRDRDEWLLLDVGTADPTYVPHEGYGGDLAERVAALEPGHRVAATLEWDGDTPRFASLDVETETVFAFVETAEGLFEAARDCWQAARRAGEAMNAQVTYSTDGDPNGVVYTFAEQPGERDLFAEFRDGVKPLDPLVDRLAEHAAPPYEVFVIDGPEPFVAVYLVLERGGLLAETVRDTYVE